MRTEAVCEDVAAEDLQLLLGQLGSKGALRAVLRKCPCGLGCESEREGSWTQVETSTTAFLFPQLSLEQVVVGRFTWEDLDGTLARYLKVATDPVLGYATTVCQPS